MKEKLINSFKFVKEFVITKKSIFMKVLAVIIIVIALIVIGSCFKGAKYGNSAGNSSNMGLAVQDGRWIYYVEVDDDEPVGICRVKNNGKKTEKVVDGYMYELNIIDNYIYCIEYNEDEYRYDLIRVKTNGKNKETLARDIDEGQVVATDKWVYYYKNDNLYRVRVDGTDREKVSDKEISYYQIDGNWIYYIYEADNSQPYIAKMKLNGENAQRIAKADEDEEYEALYVKGGKIYYIVSKVDENYDYEYSLYKMNKKGEKSEKICKIDENIQYINMQEDGIYYTTTEDYYDYEIKYIKYNGTDKKTIEETGEIEAINVVEDWIIIVEQDKNYDISMRMISIKGDKEKDL